MSSQISRTNTSPYRLFYTRPTPHAALPPLPMRPSKTSVASRIPPRNLRLDAAPPSLDGWVRNSEASGFTHIRLALRTLVAYFAAIAGREHVCGTRTVVGSLPRLALVRVALVGRGGRARPTPED
uniref:Uncharacterized protein n=1 Tax=Mycena chlorophos TaxID=658473 RepID=A0ABQ0M6X1_MYCCL|nr:predicted protein [Mycena chlorophos]